MKTNCVKMIFTIGVLTTLVACTTKTTWLMSPPKSLQAVSGNGQLPGIDITTKANVLVVVDNSGSMDPKVALVKDGMESFVNYFTTNNPLDYRFGVISIYDSVLFDRADHIQKWGKVEKGVLRPIFEYDNNLQEKLAQLNRRYLIPEDDNLINRMKATIDVPVLQPNSQGGPNFEESLSPIIILFSQFGLNRPENAGYDMGPDAFKFVILITDANDQSEKTPEEVAARLWSLVGGRKDMVSVFAAIVPPGASTATCSRDEAGPPTKIIQLVQLVDGQIGNVCNPQVFGQQMAEWAKRVRVKTLERVIQLKMGTPEYDPSDPEHSLRVFYGTEELHNGDGGYHYDIDKQTIRLGGDLQLKEPHSPNDKLTYTYMAVDWRNSKAYTGAE